MGDAGAIIAAGGRGSRFGGPVPKVFVPLAGRPMLSWSLDAFDACESVEITCVVVPEECLEDARRIVGEGPWKSVRAVVAGGEERPESVCAGLRALSSDTPAIVCVHDGARPLIDRDTIQRSIDLARRQGAAVAAVPAIDTIKQCGPDGQIEATPPRCNLYHAQTPQTFDYELLRRAYAQADASAGDVTDDASLVEQMGHPVFVSEGHRDNFKITTREDLARAESLLERRNAASGARFRVGTGYDVHALVEERPLVLGGVTIDFERGLAGHSDADVLFHAICDALLGAAALGDIGSHFPDSDPALEGADSAELARQVVNLLAGAGWRPLNIDATVICQQPRLAPHIEAMRRNVARALDLQPRDVGVKATTTEHLGFEGRGEGIAAQAVATIAPL